MTTPDDATVGKPRARLVRTALALCLLIGFMLILCSALLPDYRDPVRAAELLTTQDWQHAADREAFTRDWFRQMAELRTAKWPLQDLGMGVVALATCLLAIATRCRLGRARDFLRLKTPRSIIGFLIPGTIAWLGMDLSFVYVTIRDVDRHLAPPWADSLGIPLAALPAPFLLLPVPALIGWLLVRRAPLPVNLWLWDSNRRQRSMLWTMLCGVMVVMLVMALAMAVIDGDIIAIPLLMLALYLTASTRAAIIAKGTRS